MIYAIVAVVFVVRLVFLKVSIKNEKEILANGGKEYSVTNSKRLTVLHILFYIFAVVEALLRGANFDVVSGIGAGLLVFSMIMLYVVIRLLKGIWTVKLMLVKDHKFNNHWLFRMVKHPNYFLNIIPELIGLCMLCHALYTSIVLGVFYALVLGVRIKDENKLLSEVIIPNSIK
ncbi:isoprenylcysteine carboxyl methyltransferase family protein [Campylobacter pinnipediorum subsp. caledonicus]|uniref:Isoprenylcysteine carboxyl methyltransferase family protein n=1 Tax=Campylobacter pinnipediorum subsp. caledonicus TaxID=1874362 RepID=A0A1S6U974_9BACT|nr:isoprenylcysteine carboxyl methyltransferase family protein [Campylobacter pinnipediorum]AQW86599.1 isoprenylcysteine carboxyl methyltransferase family protein [Campylobacter pinnipediorum subsp. caledonicus]AQW88250.1 isoprenylcysteine carboxyl methyltransferase family protein [Campylobacter pinnipediorum subsp. caledonicus]OPA70611.1 hypothetical protein BB381_04445 [Campylobacter pinnipediorum subsp. caledonicus]